MPSVGLSEVTLLPFECEGDLALSRRDSLLVLMVEDFVGDFDRDAGRSSERDRRDFLRTGDFDRDRKGETERSGEAARALSLPLAREDEEDRLRDELNRGFFREVELRDGERERFARSFALRDL